MNNENVVYDDDHQVNHYSKPIYEDNYDCVLNSSSLNENYYLNITE